MPTKKDLDQILLNVKKDCKKEIEMFEKQNKKIEKKKCTGGIEKIYLDHIKQANANYIDINQRFICIIEKVLTK